MIAIKKKCLTLIVLSPFFGCMATHQNLVVDGTYKIDPVAVPNVAVPNEIHVHTGEGQTKISGKIEALTNGGTEAEGMLRLEVIGLNGEVVDMQEVCFSPTWEQGRVARYKRTVYREPQFNIVISKIYPAGSTFRFTLLKLGEECKETIHE